MGHCDRHAETPTGVDATDAAIDEFVNKHDKACGWIVPSISSKLAYMIPNEPNDPVASFFFGARIWLRMTFNYPVLWVRVKGQG